MPCFRLVVRARESAVLLVDPVLGGAREVEVARPYHCRAFVGLDFLVNREEEDLSEIFVLGASARVAVDDEKVAQRGMS